MYVCVFWLVQSWLLARNTTKYNIRVLYCSVCAHWCCLKWKLDKLDESSLTEARSDHLNLWMNELYVKWYYLLLFTNICTFLFTKPVHGSWEFWALILGSVAQKKFYNIDQLLIVLSFNYFHWSNAAKGGSCSGGARHRSGSYNPSQIYQKRWRSF